MNKTDLIDYMERPYPNVITPPQDLLKEIWQELEAARCSHCPCDDTIRFWGNQVAALGRIKELLEKYRIERRGDEPHPPSEINHWQEH